MMSLGTPPRWLLSSPKPKPESRMFNAKPFVGWIGRTSINTLVGWVDNPRIDIPVENWKDEHAGREPDNDELLDIMLDISVSDRPDDEEEDEEGIDSRRSRRNKLLELAESIRLNGIKVPLVVTYDKRIIDGNRRYFATLYLYSQSDDEDERERYSWLPVWVLPKGIRKNDEDRILTELNSINDCYVKWPYSVIAKRVYQDYKDGLSIEDLARKYHDWTKSRISTVIEACKVAEEFIEHHDDSIDARDLAYRKLIWFDELRRSNRRMMEKEPFRNAVYDLILAPNSPFSSHRDFRRLEEIFNNQEAWKALTSGGREGIRQAQFIIDRDRFEKKGDVQSRINRINSMLKEIANGPGFGSVEPDVLAQFHELADRVPGISMEVEDKTKRAMQLLDGLTSKEVAQLPRPFLKRITSVLERVRKQAESYRDKQ